MRMPRRPRQHGAGYAEIIVPLAAIAIVAIVTLRALLVDSAESYLKSLGDNAGL